MTAQPVAQLLSRFWWLIVLRGIAAILFGISAFLWPSLTISTLTILFAAYAFVDGVFEIIHAIGHRQEIDHWVLMLMEGLCGIAFGILAFQAPELTAGIGTVIVGLYIASWAIITGVIRIVMAVRLRHEIEGEWQLGLSGLVSVVFGMIIMVRPAAGALGLLYLIAAWAILLGVILIALAMKARKFGSHVRETVSAVQQKLA